VALGSRFLTLTVPLEKGTLRANAERVTLIRPPFLLLVLGGLQGVGTLSLGGVA
jgi:hypothetical protein